VLYGPTTIHLLHRYNETSLVEIKQLFANSYYQRSSHSLSFISVSSKEMDCLGDSVGQGVYVLAWGVFLWVSWFGWVFLSNKDSFIISFFKNAILYRIILRRYLNR